MQTTRLSYRFENFTRTLLQLSPFDNFAEAVAIATESNPRVCIMLILVMNKFSMKISPLAFAAFGYHRLDEIMELVEGPYRLN